MTVDRSLPYFDPRTLGKLNGLVLRACGTVEGAVAGTHRSPLRGFAAEFAEHREYAPGDDLRYVDWKIYGRTDRVFVKQFEEETNFVCQVLLDVSESMQYRSDSVTQSKLEFAKHVAAAISYVVVKQQDSVGLITFDREIVHCVRAGSQPAHWKQISHVLSEARAQTEHGAAPNDGSDRAIGAINSPLDTPFATSVLAEIAERLPQRGVVILLSDLFTDARRLIAELKRFQHRQQDLRVWQINDPAEEEFPFDAPTLFHGLEGWSDISVEPRQLRTAYQREFFAHREALRRQCRSLKIDFVSLRTDLPVDIAVKRSLTSAARTTR
jgi:uncharacterized protein (DUF58 family)